MKVLILGNYDKEGDTVSVEYNGNEYVGLQRFVAVAIPENGSFCHNVGGLLTETKISDLTKAEKNDE